jgi:perosamine synthetase
MIPVNRPLISESDIHSVTNALATTQISGTSDEVRLLEDKLQKYLNSKYFVSTSNGTSAIDCIISALNMDSHNIAVVPSMSIISTINELMRRRVRLLVVDVSEDTFMPNNDQYLNSIDSQVSIVIPTHIYGLLHDVQTLKTQLNDSGVHILEDAAEVFGVSHRDGSLAGTLGDSGIYSFYANKNITGGEGGGVVTNDKWLASNIQEIRNLGFSNSGERFIHERIGWNARLNGISAALISSQFDRLQTILKRKKEIGKRYLENLSGHKVLDFQATKFNEVENSYWVFAVKISRDSKQTALDLKNFLCESGVESRRFFYPLHLQPVVVKSGLLIADSVMPISEHLWNKGLYLPSGVGTSDQEIDYVCEKLWAWETKVTR